MYANTAYEAFYQILGLQIQEQVTRWITSEVIFRAAILIIFAAAFFVFLVHFASRYIPFFLPARRAPLGRVVGLVFCLFLGISLLKVGGATGSKSFAGAAWAGNPYVQGKSPGAQDEYRVSLIFRVLSGAAEELARGLAVLIDSTFSRMNLQTREPNFFFKAMLGAAADTIDDPRLRSDVQLYTEECLSKVLPEFNPDASGGVLDRYFSRDADADRKLAQIPAGQAGSGGAVPTCLELKRQVNTSLAEYARARSSTYERIRAVGAPIDWLKSPFGQNYENWVTSNLLVNHYLDGHEGALGVEKAAELPRTDGRVIQYINRLFSVEGVMSLFDRRDLKGAMVAASRSRELSDHLARAPHIAGFLKMLLVGFFPILVFFLAAGRWKPLVWWWMTYLSVCLWAPIWALLYHVVTALAVDVETLEAFGKLTDGVSLYAASLVSSRFYQAFAVYSWLQLLVGPTLTGTLLMCMRPMLADSQPDTMPEGVTTGVGLAAKAAGGLG
jgi:hypothetical protein